MDILNMIFANWYLILISAVLAYLLGSINTAVIVTKIVTGGKGDIRQMGSGNAGFTNVLRSVGKIPAVFTIVCDLLKAVIAVYIGSVLFGMISAGEMNMEHIKTVGKYICGCACIAGHSYPIYFHFKGGKGIVTAWGMMLVLDWRVFLIIAATFLIVFIASRIISLASLTCAAVYGIYTFLLTYFLDKGSILYVSVCTLFAFGIGIFVIIKHKDNIKRLLKGEEKKITAKK